MNIINLPEGFDGAALIQDFFNLALGPLSVCLLFLCGYYALRLVRR